MARATDPVSLPVGSNWMLKRLESLFSHHWNANRKVTDWRSRNAPCRRTWPRHLGNLPAGFRDSECRAAQEAGDD